LSTPLFDELLATLDREPDSLRSEQLLGELFWKAIEIIEKPQHKRLSQLIEATSKVARDIFGRAKPEPISWQLWYAGQMQGVAGLLRTLISRQFALETIAALHSRKHSKPILTALSAGDSRVSDLAKLVGLDDSHLGRELKVLSRHNLIETVKEGRERWARITRDGRTALNEFAKSDLTAPERGPERGPMPNEWVTEGVPTEDFHSGNPKLRLVFPNLNEEALSQSFGRFHPTLIREAVA
jgi:DNA-binding transcriptional ArsR family regulator